MSLSKTGRRLLSSLLLLLVAGLAGCGFHLRENVQLPPSMQHVHVAAGGSNDFQRQLARTLETSGITIEDTGGPGIAELRVPVARFGSDSLISGGYARITEYVVRFHVEVDAVDSDGNVLMKRQSIDMQREYSYDATDAVGNSAQVEALQKSLQDDMVQAILFRLQAAGAHELAAPASAASTH